MTTFGFGPKRVIVPFGKKWFLLGHAYNGEGWPVYLEDFEWACGWYWSGGHVVEPNRRRGKITDIRALYHFDGFNRLPDHWTRDPQGRPMQHIPGEPCTLFDGFTARFDDTPLTEGELWRLCDLMTQFYAYAKAAECFQYGGHQQSAPRPEGELNPDLAAALNRHLDTAIFPEVRRLWEEV